MKKIKNYIKDIDSELCSAKEYAEKYIWYKATNDSQGANRFKEMATDELKHATYIHEKAIQDIETISTTFKPTNEMKECWEKCHSEYVEKTAWIKQMLSM